MTSRGLLSNEAKLEISSDVFIQQMLCGIGGTLFPLLLAVKDTL